MHDVLNLYILQNNFAILSKLKKVLVKNLKHKSFELFRAHKQNLCVKKLVEALMGCKEQH